MAIEHADITDPNLHEPKGASTAASDTVYVSDGAGSGSWQLVGSGQIDPTELTTVIQGLVDDGDLTINQQIVTTVVINDISTADKIYIPVPADSTFTGALLVLEGTISGANAIIAFKNASAASLGTSVTVLESGSLPGDTYAFTATTNNDLTGPTYITIETDGGSTNTIRLFITLVFTLVS